MLPKICLAILLCCLTVATAYYENDYDYGGNDYDSGYGNDGGYGNDYGDYEVDKHHDNDDDVPTYGGSDGFAYGNTEAYEEKSRYNRRGRNSYRQQASRYRPRGGYDVYDEEDGYGEQDYGYAPRRRSYGKGRRGSRMDRHGRSGTYGYAKPQRRTPVIIKKKKQKKIKIIAVHAGFYIPGGTAIFGKFKDLKSCQKACELTPTCFSGDFNPWLNKCYMHSNLTACQSMRAHKQITHFKKVPCNVVETPRGLITLGAGSLFGLKQTNIDTLMDCIKKCATAGGGVAPTPETAAQTPQLCFGIDYDFADHTCYFHTLIAICGGGTDANALPLTPVSLYANPSTVNILICPLTT